MGISKSYTFGGSTPIVDATHLLPSSSNRGMHVPQLLMLMALRCPLFKNTLHPND